MQNRLSLYLDRKRVMQNVLTFYLNQKRVMQNGRKGFLQGRIAYAPSRQPKKKRMIRNTDTCGAYAIRPYPDGRKDLSLRSIWGYEKQYNLLFDLENVHAELIIPLLGSRKSYAKCIDLLFESKKGHAKWQERISGTCF